MDLKKGAGKRNPWETESSRNRAASLIKASRLKERRLRASEPTTTTTPSTPPDGSKKKLDSTAAGDPLTPQIMPDSDSTTAPASIESDRFVAPIPNGIGSPLAICLRTIIPHGWRSIFHLFSQLDLGPNDPRVGLILVWNMMTSRERQKATPEDLCARAGISYGRLLYLVEESARERNQLTSSIVRSMNATTLVQKAISYGKGKEGFKDREMLLKSSGFVPMPSGTQINNTAVANSKSGAVAGRLDESLEEMEEDTLEFTEIVRAASDTKRRESPADFVTDEFGGDS
jgi:hypothetical protein